MRCVVLCYYTLFAQISENQVHHRYRQWWGIFRLCDIEISKMLQYLGHRYTCNLCTIWLCCVRMIIIVAKMRKTLGW